MGLEDIISLTRALPEAIYLLSPDGQIKAANPAGIRLSGLTGSEISGKPLKLLVEESAEKVATYLKSWARSSSLAPGTLTWRQQEAKPLVCRCGGSAVRFSSQNPALYILLRCQPRQEENRFVMLNQQLDKLKRAQHTLLANKQQLEQEVARRTRELVRSNQELEQFAYIASHDLQEPLRKVMAFSDRLKAKCDHALDEKSHDYLKRIQNATKRMQTFINDLLMFSRLTTKAQPFVALDLDALVREIIVDMELRIEETGGRVELEGLPCLEADPLQMRQLFQNLIGNALKFHKKELPPLVKIRGISPAAQAFTENLPGNEYYQITVKDNGIGFDEKHAERIFAVFQRLHSRDEYAGTGIGLSICRKITERHGGRVTARSSPGQGTEFTIILPLRQPKESPHE